MKITNIKAREARDYLKAAETVASPEVKFDIIAQKFRRVPRAPSIYGSGFDNETVGGTVEKAIIDRRRRAGLFPSCLFAEPAWDILLHLYRVELLQARTVVSTVCRASHVPATTALRWISRLESCGLVTRDPDRFDARRVYLRLADQGSAAMALYFRGEPALAPGN